MNIDEIRKELLLMTLHQYQKPYSMEGNGPNSFDSANLAWYIYKEVLDLDIYKDGYGHSSTTKIMTSSYGKLELYKEGLKKLEFNDFKLGDILLFHDQSLKDTSPTPNNKYPGHCGIYIGGKDFIHASSVHNKIILTRLDGVWEMRLVGKKDILDDIKVLEKIKRD